MKMHRNCFVALILIYSQTALASPDDSSDLDCQAVLEQGKPGFALRGEFRSEPKTPQFKRVWVSSLSFTEESFKERDPIGLLARWSAPNRLDFGWSPGKSGKGGPVTADRVKAAFEFSLELIDKKESTLVASREGQSRLYYANCQSEPTCQRLSRESKESAASLFQSKQKLLEPIKYLGLELAEEVKKYLYLFKASSGSQVTELEMLQNRLSDLPKNVKEFEARTQKNIKNIQGRIQRETEEVKKNHCHSSE